MPLQLTGLCAALLTLLFIGLGLRIVFLRRSNRVGLGDGGDSRLACAIRAHANFTEVVPLALILMALMEMAAVSRTWLMIYGGGLVIARCLHAWGLSGSAGVSFGRFWGTFITWLLMLLAAIFLLYWFFAALVISSP